MKDNTVKSSEVKHLFVRGMGERKHDICARCKHMRLERGVACTRVVRKALE